MPDDLTDIGLGILIIILMQGISAAAIIYALG